jgi:CDP-2,3-bis-(O-geranylgeranyl)-sn-glycerol synthase
MDLGRGFRGRRIFGDSKTFRGFLGGALCGTALGAAQQAFFNKPDGLLLGLLLGFGAMTGDLVKSFFKRQRDIPPGHPWFPFDQLDFLVGGLLFAAVVETPTLIGAIILLLVTPPLHILSNVIDYRLGLKRIPS